MERTGPVLWSPPRATRSDSGCLSEKKKKKNVKLLLIYRESHSKMNKMSHMNDRVKLNLIKEIRREFFVWNLFVFREEMKRTTAESSTLTRFPNSRTSAGTWFNFFSFLFSWTFCFFFFFCCWSSTVYMRCDDVLCAAVCVHNCWRI